jgi:hypothetical protein
MTLLAVAAFLGYLKGRGSESSKRRIWHLASWLLYGLAILTKEWAIVLPALVFTYEWIFCPASPAAHGPPTIVARFLRALRPALPFLGVTVAYLAARWMALGGLSHMQTPIVWRAMVATWPLDLWMHIKILLWPVGLSGFYDVPYVSHPGLSNCVLPLAALLVCGFLALWMGSRSVRAAFAGVWLFLPMLLLLNLRVFPEGEIVHDRFMYFPSVGFAFLMGLGAERLMTFGRPKVSSCVLCRWAVVLALGLGLGAATVHYSGFWANDWTLYGRALAVAPGNNLAANNLASDLADEGRYPEAIAIYRQILARDPMYYLGVYNLGYCLYRMGAYEAACSYLQRAITLNATEPEPFVYLGLADFRVGRAAEAAANLRQGIVLSPDNPRYHFALGMILKSQGDVIAARQEFAAALALDPNLADASEQIAEIDRQPSGK